jgi:hypothetical protein
MKWVVVMGDGEDDDGGKSISHTHSSLSLAHGHTRPHTHAHPGLSLPLLSPPSYSDIRPSPRRLQLAKDLVLERSVSLRLADR